MVEFCRQLGILKNSREVREASGCASCTSKHFFGYKACEALLIHVSCMALSVRASKEQTQGICELK